MKNIKQLERLVLKLLKKIEEKNRSYGDSFANSAKTFGDKSVPESGRVLRAYCLRVSDKLHRINALVSEQKTTMVGESAKDALEDVIGYTIVVLNSLWDDLNPPSSK